MGIVYNLSNREGRLIKYVLCFKGYVSMYSLLVNA